MHRPSGNGYLCLNARRGPKWRSATTRCSIVFTAIFAPGHLRGLIGETMPAGWRTSRAGVALLACSCDHLISWWLRTDQCAAEQQHPSPCRQPLASRVLRLRLGFTVTAGNLGRTSRYHTRTAALRDPLCRSVGRGVHPTAPARPWSSWCPHQPLAQLFRASWPHMLSPLDASAVPPETGCVGRLYDQSNMQAVLPTALNTASLDVRLRSFAVGRGPWAGPFLPRWSV